MCALIPPWLAIARRFALDSEAKPLMDLGLSTYSTIKPRVDLGIYIIVDFRARPGCRQARRGADPEQNI